MGLPFSLERFKRSTVGNPDGWGTGWYKDSLPSVFNQVIAATNPDGQFDRFSKDVMSKIIIVHVTKRTKGKKYARFLMLDAVRVSRSLWIEVSYTN